LPGLLREKIGQRKGYCIRYLQCWLDPVEGVRLLLPFMLATAIYRREANKEAVDIGTFFADALGSPYRHWWICASDGLVYLHSRSPSSDELHGLEELHKLMQQQRPLFAPPLSGDRDELVGIGGESKGYEAVLSSLRPDLRPAQSQLFTTSNGSHTRCKAVFPSNEASISILQIIFPSFGAKLVHPSVNLPTWGHNIFSYHFPR
jgi:hypothetical protein